MKEEDKSIFISCITQIMQEGDKVNINLDGNVTFTFAKKNGTIGQHQIEFEKFKELVLSNLDFQMLLSNLIGMSYNKVLEAEGSDVRLMV